MRTSSVRVPLGVTARVSRPLSQQPDEHSPSVHRKWVPRFLEFKKA